MKVLKLAYHRNGVGGAPFYVGIIKDGRKKRVVIRFDDLDDVIGQVMCVALDINMLNENNVEDNALRGEYYVRAIDEAIEKRTEVNKRGLLVEKKRKGNGR
jgi:hypothetical protein